MQDVGSKEDTELIREDLTLSWRELRVESLGHCQPVGNWMFFPARVHEKLRTQVYSFLWKNTCQRAVGRLVARHRIGTFGETGESQRKLCPNNLCHLRGSPQKFGNNLGTENAEYRTKP